MVNSAARTVSRCAWRARLSSGRFGCLRFAWRFGVGGGQLGRGVARRKRGAETPTRNMYTPRREARCRGIFAPSPNDIYRVVFARRSLGPPFTSRPYRTGSLSRWILRSGRCASDEVLATGSTQKVRSARSQNIVRSRVSRGTPVGFWKWLRRVSEEAQRCARRLHKARCEAPTTD